MSALAPEQQTPGDGGLATVLGELRSEIAGLREEVKELRGPRLEILSEPLTYAAHLIRDSRGVGGFRAVSNGGEPRSYIKDFVLAHKRGDQRAEARLNRHAQEMRSLSHGREALFAPSMGYEFEQRAPNWSAGTGGYSAPPVWIIDQFAIVPTPQQILSARAPRFDLPMGAQSVNLPRWTAGATAGAPQLNAADTSVDITDSIVSSAVTTISGQEDVPLQMLEQSPVGAHLDWAVFSSLEAQYGYQLELQLINGNGVASGDATRSGNDQILGILNNGSVPAANIIAYTGQGDSGGATGGATAMYPYLGQAIAAIGKSRLAPPELCMMTTARLGWLGTQEDSSNRPLMLADNDGTGSFDIVTFETALNDAIPRTINTNQEPIFFCRPSDWIILESERHVQVMPDVLSGTMEVRLQLRRYAAALLRYPQSVAYLIGSGMAVAGAF